MAKGKKQFGLVVALILGLLAFGFEVGAFGGFHDDPGDSCLGDSDPFCTSGGSENCKYCSIKQNAEGQIIQASCKSGAGTGDVCTIIWDGDDVTCDIDGNC